MTTEMGTIKAATLLIQLCMGVVIASADSGQNHRLNTQGNLAFQLLRKTPEWMGFHKGAFPMVLNDDDHWQGIARGNSNGLQYLYLTRSGEFDSLPEYPALDIVRMGSRTSGPERMRSNRLVSGERTPSSSPDSRDFVVNEIRFYDYRHPGGIQICGDILVIPFEGRRYDSLPQGVVKFYSLADPENPIELVHAGPIEKDHNIGVTGLTRLAGGHYFLALTWGANRNVQFFRSSTTDLLDPATIWEFIVDVPDDDIPGWPVNFGEGIGQYQTMNFIDGADGSLYMFVARNTTQASTEDRAALYRVDTDGATYVTMTQSVAETNFYCSPWNGASVQCNFLAAAGAYVSPSGQLIIYAAEHYDDGPGGSIKLAEFNSATDRNGSAAWIQLYEHSNEGGRSIIIDGVDQNLDDYDDFEQLDGETLHPRIGFNDLVSSYVWFAPVGCSIVLYEDDSNQTPLRTLTGNGQIQVVHSLPSGVNDEISSVEFTGSICGSTAHATLYLCSAGTNANCGTVPGQPKRTLDRAAFWVANGGTVRIYEGTYTEPITINKAVTLEAHLGEVTIR